MQRAASAVTRPTPARPRASSEEEETAVGASDVPPCVVVGGSCDGRYEEPSSSSVQSANGGGGVRCGAGSERPLPSSRRRARSLRVSARALMLLTKSTEARFPVPYLAHQMSVV